MTTASVTFVGLGYIGLPTAVVMANHGVNVTGVDIKAESVDKINQGCVTIVEPGLETGLKQALESGNFRATTEMVRSENFIIAVPTPFNDDMSVDMKYIYSAAESIAPTLQGGELIVLESTSPPTTTEKMAERILKLRSDLAADGSHNPQSKPVIYFAHCPERILPGNAMEELLTNDRIIGGVTQEATQRAQRLYSTFCSGKLLATNATTAEMAKLTENSFRDVNIAFANELSLICDHLDINVWELIDLANHHPRVNILQPGPGVGGHCIAVDPWFIVSTDPIHSKLIKTARLVNDSKPKYVIDKVASAIEGLEDPRVAALGLAFKANIDDLRESPSLEIVKELAFRNPKAQVSVVEPNISVLPDSLSLLRNLTLTSLEEAIKESDIVVVLVDHKEFLEYKTDLSGKVLVDTKGIWGESTLPIGNR
ncbi:UDP-N-acetyl-D-mannosamine dehydrogenase [Corynebacterium suedekumii]|uniref:UDP-N-acetyl-D-mannosamine dehydrogenase n=1 Tax=Corynebacterium suedekumii TaxID=3049801 RepID=A0ABY8VKN2_9CORY|nr:UDP-N-acetyl-D-mannosamine dehydrogenase [Corynebacterium suedekumii]WIM70200.1 UDP-N-acetyl-D-mannosamine dehydrogenase [Corynebacterium suedekumii]